VDLHNEIGHFGEGITLAKVTKHYFWHNRIEEVKDVVQLCKCYRLVKCMSFVKFKLEKLRNIPIWDQFYRMALHIIESLPKTYNGNRYILVAIDHYFKWSEAKAVVDHDAKNIARFLEDEIICRFGLLKYIIIDNGFEWATELNQLCKNYKIVHQHPAP
jgi:hypothetical protein